MMDFLAVQRAVRAHLTTLVVADSGVIDLGSSGTAITRTTGSFLADGFAPGMEVEVTGFGAPVTGVVEAVSPLSLTVAGVPSGGPAPGRRVLAGLPSGRAWEGETFEPIEGRPFFAEQFLPGPTRQASVGPGGTVVMSPSYVAQFYAPAGHGIGALRRYADQTLRHFPPRAAFPLPSGRTLRVRTDASSYAGQIRQARTGWAVITVSIPLRVYAPNII